MSKIIYDFRAKTIEGKEFNFAELKDKNFLIVNTASKCGFAPQLKELEDLYKKYNSKNFEILGFPCNQFNNQEAGTDEEIKSFCEINYGVTFRMFSKVDVNGEKAHPLFVFLKEKKSGLFGKNIKWNFTKFLVDRKGNVLKRYAPSKSPKKIENDLKKLFNEVSK